MGILKTVVTVDPRTSVHRSALMLLLFLVVHVAGNLLFFVGPDAFNLYGDKLRKNPLIVLIEGYLLLSFVLHAVVGAYLTFNKRNVLLKGPVTRRLDQVRGKKKKKRKKSKHTR